MESKIMLFADIAKSDSEYDVITVAKINHDKTIEILDSTALNVKYNSYEERQAEFNKMVDKIAKQYDALDILKDGEFLEDSEFEKRNKVRKLATSRKPIIIGNINPVALEKFRKDWEANVRSGGIQFVSTADPDFGIDYEKPKNFGIKESIEKQIDIIGKEIKSLEPKGKSKFHK